MIRHTGRKVFKRGIHDLRVHVFTQLVRLNSLSILLFFFFGGIMFLSAERRLSASSDWISDYYTVYIHKLMYRD